MDLPWLMVAGGIATLVFEIGFMPALFFRTSRFDRGPCGVGVPRRRRVTMAIWFDPVYPLIVLLDFPHVLRSPLTRPFVRRLSGVEAKLRDRKARFDAWLEQLGKRLSVYRERPSPRRRFFQPAAFAGAVLVASMGWAGVVSFDSWPVSVYPKFSGRAMPTRASYGLTFHAKAPDGSERELENSFYPVEDSASVYKLFDAAERRERRGDDAAALEIYELLVRLVLGNNPPLAAGERVVIRRFEFFVDPERRKGRARRPRDLIELDPPPRVPAP